MKVPTILNAPRQAPQLTVGGIGDAGNPSAGAAIFQGLGNLGEALQRNKAKVEQDQTNLDRFELNQTNLEEINFAQEAFKTAQEQPQDNPSLFANNFMQSVTERHKQILDVQKVYGYKPEELQTLDTQLSVLRSHLLGQALSFQTGLETSKAETDINTLTDSLSRYAVNNPTAMDTIRQQLHDNVFQHPHLTDVQKENLFEQKWEQVRTIGAQAYIAAHPDEVINLWDPKRQYAPPPVLMPGSITTGTAAGGKISFAPENYSRATVKQAIAHAETRGQNIRNLNGGRASSEYQFMPDTFAGLYKQVYGVAPPKGKDAITYSKDVRERVMDQAVANYETTLKGAGLPVDNGNMYVLHALGTGMGPKLLQADPNEPVAAFFRHVAPKQAAAIISGNGALYSGNKTVADSVNLLRSRVGSAPVTYQQGGDNGQVPVNPGNVGPTGVLAQTGSLHTEQRYDANGAPLPVATGQAAATPVDSSLGKPTGNAALDVLHGDEILRYLGIAYSIRQQRNEAAAQAARQAQQATTLQEKQAHDEKLNNLLNALNDGTATAVSIETARREGWLTDFDEIHKAQSIIASRQKIDTDMANLGAYLNGGAQWNPYDKGAQDAAETWFAASMDPKRNGGKPAPDPLALAEHIWRSSGIMPKQGITMIRGALASPDQNKVAAAASIASNILRTNPRAFAGQDGEEEIRQDVAAYESVTYGTSGSAQEAAAKVQHLRDPKVDRAFAPNDTVRNAMLKDISQLDMAKVFRDRLGNPDTWMPNFIEGAPADFGSVTAREEARVTFGEAAMQHYDRYKDPAAANRAAINEIQRLYGVVDGRIIKYPPNKAYHAVAGGHSYIMEQAHDDVKNYAGVDIPTEDIWLDAAQSGATSEAYRSGGLVPYQIFYRTWQDGQPVIHKMPKLFVADPATAQAQQAIKAEQEHKTAQDYQRLREQFQYFPGPGGP